MPPFVGPVLAAHLDEFGRYPVNKGIDAFRRAAAGWLGRRYSLPRPVDPETEVLVLNGTREGLFLAAIAAKRYVPPRAGKPAILIPNPFYAAYSAGADAAGCEPVYLPAHARDRLPARPRRHRRDLLARTVAFYLASPSNPQGAVADRDYLERLVALARRFGFLVFCRRMLLRDLPQRPPPPGMLEARGPTSPTCVVFHSLSKRSNLPGLRVGFAAGDTALPRRASSNCAMSPRRRCRSRRSRSRSPPMTTRRMSRTTARSTSPKFDLADQIIGNRYGYRRPAGGFFLWLDVSRKAATRRATKRLWREGGRARHPGTISRARAADGRNPGADYIRVAMVQDKATTAEALHRLVAVLG